eukprot:Nk52_evm16s234 gene=Nk52_evmTU16s234
MSEGIERETGNKRAHNEAERLRRQEELKSELSARRRQHLKSLYESVGATGDANSRQDVTGVHTLVTGVQNNNDTSLERLTQSESKLGELQTFLKIAISCMKDESDLKPKTMRNKGLPKVFKFYSKSKVCNAKDKCRFIHEGNSAPKKGRAGPSETETPMNGNTFCDNENDKKKVKEAANVIVADSTRKVEDTPKKQCRVFARNGKCRRNEKCPFVHRNVMGAAGQMKDVP